MQHNLDNFLQSQLHQKRLVIISDRYVLNMRIQQEKTALVHLQQKPDSYLNQYDQLFRLVSLMLLKQSYDLSGFQPHQVLKGLMQILYPHLNVDAVIQQRHWLKKRISTKKDLTNMQALQEMLGYTHDKLQAYEIHRY